MVLVKRVLIAVLVCGVCLAQAQAATTRTRAKNRLPTKPVEVDLPGELLLQTGHATWVTSVAFSPDGKLLATASADKTVKLWLVHNRQEIRSIPAHTAWVTAVAFSPNGQLLATAGADKTVKLWTLRTPGKPRTSQRTAVGQTTDITAKLWRTLVGHPADVTAVAFSPNGAL